MFSLIIQGNLPRGSIVSDKPPVNVAKVLKDSGAEILLNYLPVGSRQGTRYYAEASLDAGCAFINAIPVFIASNAKWQQAFVDRKLPCAGDDVMSQLGATVVHKTLVKLFVDRGVTVDQTYQLNIGGDMDFYNMLDEERLEDKRVSKTSVVDAYNSAGVMIDAVRATKIALDRGISGPLDSVSAYCFKHPPVQLPYSVAKSNFLEFVEGKRER